jgi:alpha-D-ribose 1-methylphosphonate 5-triphosphate synthase subunit PhnH
MPPIVPPPAVHAAQRTFRMLLNAMARPGEIFKLAIPADETPTFAVCMTLLDFEVAYAITADDADAAEAAALDQRIALEIGCRQSSLAEAAFILSYGALPEPAWGVVRRGTLAYPDEGATIIYIVSALGPTMNGSAPTILTLTGPGIEAERTLIVHGLDASEFAQFSHVNGDYPMGVDAILLDAHSQVACLPRSCTIAARDANTEGAEVS